MIIAVDFDGTLSNQHTYPKITYNLSHLHLALLLNTLREKHNHTLILNTCRTGDLLDTAVKFCKEILLLEFDYINENTPERIEEFGGDCRKISADFYLDDGYNMNEVINVLYLSLPRTNFIPITIWKCDATYPTGE